MAQNCLSQKDEFEENEQSRDAAIWRHPPNELISKRYAADIVPMMRLVPLKDERLGNQCFVPPKLKNFELEQFVGRYQQEDTLGHHYGQKVNQMVYLKYNPKDYQDIQHSRRVISTLFVPFNYLHVASTCAMKEFYAALPRFPYTEYHPQVLKSFGGNNYGCRFDPKFSSNYETANLFAVIRKRPYEYDLILQSDINSDADIAWFNFAVEFVEEGYYSFNIVNLTKDTPFYGNGLRIAYKQLSSFQNQESQRNGEGWSFGCEKVSFQRTNIIQENNKKNNYHQLHFEYRCKNRNDSVMFAYNVAYGGLDLERFFKHLQEKKIKQMIQLSRAEIGRTLLGTPIYVFTVTRKKAHSTIRLNSLDVSDPMQRKHKTVNFGANYDYSRSIFSGSYEQKDRSLVFIARQSASDVQSSFVVEGMIEFILESLESESLKKILSFHFFPNMNPDGTKYGNNRYNLTGTDLEKVWKTPSKERSSEVYYLKQYLVQLNKQSPISLCLSLRGETENVYSSFHAQLVQPEAQDPRIFPHIFAKRNANVDFASCSFQKSNSTGEAYVVLTEIFPKTLNYEFRISPFDVTEPTEGNSEQKYRQHTPDSFRFLGRDLLETYLEYCRLSQKNTLIREKWINQIGLTQESIVDLEHFGEDRFKILFSEEFMAISKIHLPKTVKPLDRLPIFEEDCINRCKDRKWTLPYKRNSKEHRVMKDELHPLISNQFLREHQERRATNTNELKSIYEQDQKTNLLTKTAKKESILKDCSSNVLNFDIDSMKQSSQSQQTNTKYFKKIREDHRNPKKSLLSQTTAQENPFAIS